MNYTPQQALSKLISGNNIYLHSRANPSNISPARRFATATNGQRPFAAVLTCSDSRIPPEHIFTAGLGELFTVRTSGNVVGNFEIGSIEYAVEHLGVPILLVMGHSQCGAVVAALEDHADGYIEDVIHEIQLGLNGATEEGPAICNNILHSKNQIMKSTIVRKYLLSDKLAIVCALYNIETGKVDFFNC